MKILVPSGIGDGYWVIVKLKGFIKRAKIKDPEIWVDGGEPRRSHGMWERVPFVRWGGYAPPFPKHRSTQLILNRAYRLPGNAVQRNVLGYDYFVSLNGTLVSGQSLDHGMPDPTNWYEPFSRMEVTDAEATKYAMLYGSYVVVGLWEHGFYRKWLAALPEAQIVEVLRSVADAGHTVVLMGAAWDKGGIAERVASSDERFVNLVAETSFDELTGLLQGASACFGFPSGTTILGPRFRTPTLMLWHHHFRREFWANACPPDRAIYYPMNIVGAKPATLAEALLYMAAQGAAR